MNTDNRQPSIDSQPRPRTARPDCSQGHGRRRGSEGAHAQGGAPAPSEVDPVLAANARFMELAAQACAALTELQICLAENRDRIRFDTAAEALISINNARAGINLRGLKGTPLIRLGRLVPRAVRPVNVRFVARAPQAPKPQGIIQP